MQRITYSKIWLNLTFAALNLTFIRGQKAFPVFHAERVIIRLPCGEGQSTVWMAKFGKGMLFSVEQAFVGRDERRAPLKTPAWGGMKDELPQKRLRGRLAPSPVARVSRPRSLHACYSSLKRRKTRKNNASLKAQFIRFGCPLAWIVVGSLSNNDGDGYQNVT